MNRAQKTAFGLCLGIAVAGTVGCGENKYAPLWEGKKNDSTLTSIFISDLHMGIDNAFAENVTNVPYLVNFLNRAKVTDDLDEIVIVGDMFDGWYLPFSYGVIKDYKTFYQEVAKTNIEFVNVVNSIIKDGKIKVVYLPGNHDVDLSEDIVASIFPGITQARDADGVGTYRTGLRKEIAAEHGHRYNVFCAPDNMTDKELRKNSVLFGPGYFYTRLAATSLTTGFNKRSYEFPDFGMPLLATPEILSAYKLYKVWDAASSAIGVPGMGFYDKVIPCGLAGYADFYAMSDLVPLYRDGKLTDTLFKGIDTNWVELQKQNLVNVIQDYGEAVFESAELEATDRKAYNDYFDVDKLAEVVVFGHTHVPLLYKNKEDYQKTTYVNTGTWIDHNINGDNTTRTYVKIVSSKSSDDVTLFTFNPEE